MWKHNGHEFIGSRKVTKIPSFFYTKASNRRRRNRINSLKNDEGEWIEGNRLDKHVA